MPLPPWSVVVCLCIGSPAVWTARTDKLGRVENVLHLACGVLIGHDVDPGSQVGHHRGDEDKYGQKYPDCESSAEPGLRRTLRHHVSMAVILSV